MKNLIYLFLFSVPFIFSCNNDDWNIDIEPFIIDNYRDDAQSLYFQEILRDSTTHPNYNNINLDEGEIEKILKIIQAVYNLDIPEKDTVFNVYDIIARPCYSFNSINLQVDTGAAEIKNLVQGNRPTGSTAFDDILETYSFDSVRTSFSFPNFPWLNLSSTTREYNMLPFVDKFNQIQSITYTELSAGCFTDGNRITLDRNSDSATITFGVGFGDCPSGCFYHINWEFEVEDGIAKFVRRFVD